MEFLKLTKKETEIIEFNELKIQKLHKKLLKYKKLKQKDKVLDIKIDIFDYQRQIEDICRMHNLPYFNGLEIKFTEYEKRMMT